MSTNAWINDEVSIEEYLTHTREQAKAEAIEYVDRLGPANEEQRTERKATRRAERRVALRRVATTVGIDAVFGLGMLVGLVVGSLNPDLVLGLLP